MAVCRRLRDPHSPPAPAQTVWQSPPVRNNSHRAGNQTGDSCAVLTKTIYWLAIALRASLVVIRLKMPMFFSGGISVKFRARVLALLCALVVRSFAQSYEHHPVFDNSLPPGSVYGSRA